MNVFNIEFGIKTLLKNCELNGIYITDCINEKYDEMLGKTYQDMVLRLMNQTLTIFDGYDSIFDKTGCLRSCTRHVRKCYYCYFM